MHRLFGSKLKFLNTLPKHKSFSLSIGIASTLMHLIFCMHILLVSNDVIKVFLNIFKNAKNFEKRTTLEWCFVHCSH